MTKVISSSCIHNDIIRGCIQNDIASSKCTVIIILGGCPFNGRPLSGIKFPTRESPHRDAASPIKYNGLRMRPAAVCAQPGVPYRDIIDWPAVLCCQRLQEASRVNLNSKNANSP